VVEIAGGEHHSIARTKDGLVYCWGRNDEGQLGLGDTYGEWRKKKAQEDAEKAIRDAEQKQKAEQEAKQKAAEEASKAAAEQAAQITAEGDQPQPTSEAAEQPASEPAAVKPTKKTVKKPQSKPAEVHKEEDLKYIYYFYRPQLVEGLWKDTLQDADVEADVRKRARQVQAAGQYSYAVCNDGVYSWGMGENYVLGNRDDCN